MPLAPDWTDDREENLPEVELDRQETVRLVAEMIDDLPEDQKLCLLLYYSHPPLFPNPSIANQNLSRCVNAVCNGPCIQPPHTLSEPPRHSLAHEVGSRCNQRIGAAAVRSRFLEPRHKFRRELLLYILVTLHTLERAGSSPSYAACSRGKPSLLCLRPLPVS